MAKASAGEAASIAVPYRKEKIRLTVIDEGDNDTALGVLPDI